MSYKFQSTHPLRGATASLLSCVVRCTFQSTYPLRGATCKLVILVDRIEISIHAPLAGCDRHSDGCAEARQDFNPRTPCGVRLLIVRTALQKFVISIHAPHAGCDYGQPKRALYVHISIHAPHAGCDGKHLYPKYTIDFISIHAPRRIARKGRACAKRREGCAK